MLKKMIFYFILALIFVLSLIFTRNNHAFFDRPIARVVEVELTSSEEKADMFGNEDELFTQEIVALIKNGEEEGQYIHMTNTFSLSGGNDQAFRVGDDVFVFINRAAQTEEHLNGFIQDVKRDTYMVVVAWVFLFVLLFIGKKQGLFSVFSLIINATLLSIALDIYLAGSNIPLLLIMGICLVLFTGISLVLVNGWQEKTFAAMIATLLGSFASLLITFLVMALTEEQGLRFEEMQFVTRPHLLIFMAGVMIGSLGAVMDVAITMSSAVFTLYEKNEQISISALKQSGMNVGRDIMGTMTNILFFAYVSGSIPMLILFFANRVPIGFTLSMNLSLELARALAGGIGIVLTVPIGLYTSIFFIQRKRVKA